MKTFFLVAACLYAMVPFHPAFASSDAWPEVIETSAPAPANAQKSDGQEVKNTIAAIKAYSVEKRDEAAVKAKAALDNFDARMKKLEARAKAGEEHALQVLREQRAEAAKLLEDMKASSKQAWESAKAAFLESYEKLEEKFKKANEKQ